MLYRLLPSLEEAVMMTGKDFIVNFVILFAVVFRGKRNEYPIRPPPHPPKENKKSNSLYQRQEAIKKKHFFFLDISRDG